jgi:hypothetical protein
MFPDTRFAAPRIIDGSLSSIPDGRTQLIERMAADLVRFDSWRNANDAWRSLWAEGWKTYEISLVIEDARAVAQLDVVTEVMGDVL